MSKTLNVSANRRVDWGIVILWADVLIVTFNNWEFPILKVNICEFPGGTLSGVLSVYQSQNRNSSFMLQLEPRRFSGSGGNFEPVCAVHDVMQNYKCDRGVSFPTHSVTRFIGTFYP